MNHGTSRLRQHLQASSRNQHLIIIIMIGGQACTVYSLPVWRKVPLQLEPEKVCSPPRGSSPCLVLLTHYLGRAAGPSELSVVLCSDAHIARLNGEWRQKAEATDVLSFPMEQDSGDGCPLRMLGDLIISLDTAQRQADERG